MAIFPQQNSGSCGSAAKNRVPGSSSVGAVDDPARGYRIRLVRLSVRALYALLDGDLGTAREVSGAPLTEYFLSEAWLWRIRAEQVRQAPDSAAWIARAAVVEPDGYVVGHVGFHGPPDQHGMVEVAYSVDPAHRRRGFGRALLGSALGWAAGQPDVRVVRASIRPDNLASLATIRPFGFVQVGEQWDDEDGLELVYERPVQH
jgi:RimJ/RimL family protein N-acetyltransferase